MRTIPFLKKPFSNVSTALPTWLLFGFSQKLLHQQSWVQEELKEQKNSGKKNKTCHFSFHFNWRKLYLKAMDIFLNLKSTVYEILLLSPQMPANCSHVCHTYSANITTLHKCHFHIHVPQKPFKNKQNNITVSTLQMGKSQLKRIVLLPRCGSMVEH